MQKACKIEPSTMAAIIGIESDKINEICQNVEGVVAAVNYNEPMQTVIAGEQEAIKKACDLLLEAGAKRAIVLPVSGPFHSSLMKEAGEKLKEEFKKFSFNNPKIGFIANTDAKNINTKEQILDELYKQTFGPVKWVKTIQYLKEMGVTEFYEIGPGKVLRGLARKIDKSIKVKSVNSLKDLEKIVK
jgi:[acyl-carrier-protein] S-malonyltransferase